MFNIDSYKTDPGKEKDGVWIELEGGLKILVAAMGNPNMEKYMERHKKDLLKEMRRAGVKRIEEIPDERLKPIFIRGMARHILLDWKNMTEGSEAVEIPYSHEKAEEYLNIPRFFSIVQDEANDLQNFQNEAKEEVKGN